MVAQSIDSSAASRVMGTAPFHILIVGQINPPESEHYSKTGASLRHLAYLQTEFPSEWPRLPNISSSVSHSLAKFFLSKLPDDLRIERVYWAFEGTVLRIWTIIDHPDYEFEKIIYEAQLQFMDTFPDLECDFSVIYRLGKSVESLKIEGAMLVSRDQ